MLFRSHGPGLIVRAEGHATGAQVAAHEAVPAAMELAHWLIAGGAVARGRTACGVPQSRLPARFEAAEAMPWEAPPSTVGPVACGWLAGVEFGQLRAKTLAELAALGALRMTPWRMVLIEGATRAPELAGLIAHPDDPLLRVIACAGAPSCLQAAAATRPLARALAAHVPPGELLHVSGCTKGCAHSGKALTLVATPAGFDLIHFIEQRRGHWRNVRTKDGSSEEQKDNNHKGEFEIDIDFHVVILFVACWFVKWRFTNGHRIYQVCRVW